MRDQQAAEQRDVARLIQAEQIRKSQQVRNRKTVVNSPTTLGTTRLPRISQ